MEDKKTEEKQASVPYFIHEGDMTRMDMAMDKLKETAKDAIAFSKETITFSKDAIAKLRTALIAVCITLLLSVLIFSITYTVNNNHWMQYVNQLTQSEELTNAEKTSELRQLRHCG